MQINLKFHGEKFSRLTDLLHSPTNVDYGASYLIKLAIDRGSWREGVMDYHNKVSAGRRQWYGCKVWNNYRSEEHTSELQSLMRISYAVFCLKKKKTQPQP